MREARRATDLELYQLSLFVAEDIGEYAATILVERATFIAVFDDYKEDRSSPYKKIMLVVWEAPGNQCEFFAWAEGPLYQLESRN